MDALNLDTSLLSYCKNQYYFRNKNLLPTRVLMCVYAIKYNFFVLHQIINTNNNNTNNKGVEIRFFRSDRNAYRGKQRTLLYFKNP